MNDTKTIGADLQASDPVLTEIWRIKEEIAAERDDDVRKIAAAAIEAQERDPCWVVDLSKREK